MDISLRGALRHVNLKGRRRRLKASITVTGPLIKREKLNNRPREPISLRHAVHHFATISGIQDNNRRLLEKKRSNPDSDRKSAANHRSTY
jgi:hypothetical protein